MLFRGVVFYFLMFISSGSGSALAQSANFKEYLDRCVDRIEFNFSGDMISKLGDILRDSEVTGRITAESTGLSDFLELWPEDQRKDAYILYVECLKDARDILVSEAEITKSLWLDVKPVDFEPVSRKLELYVGAAPPAR